MVQAGRSQCVRPKLDRLPFATYRHFFVSCSTANQCYQQAAEYSADLGDFGRAIELYEQVGDWSLASPLTKYSVKEYWLRACLCAMAMGVSASAG